MFYLGPVDVIFLNHMQNFTPIMVEMLRQEKAGEFLELDYLTRSGRSVLI